MVKKSLKQNLNEWIRNAGYVSHTDIRIACETGKFGRTYRLSNAERRLRPSESPDIEEVMENGYIIAYKHKNPVKFREARVLNEDGSVNKIIRLPI